MNLTVSALDQCDFVPGILCKSKQSDGNRLGQAPVELETSPELLDRILARHSTHLDFVGLGDLVLCGHDAVCEVSVVCQDQETFGVVVKTPDRKQPGRGVVPNQVHHGQPSFGVTGAGDAGLRLMQDQVPKLGPGPNSLSVYRDLVGINISLRSKLADHDAVDADTSRLDQFLGLATRGDSGARNDLLESFAHDRKRVPA